MATTQQHGADTQHQYVDFDEYVGFHLSKTQSGIKYSEILTTLGWIATLGLAYLFVFTLLDHWVIEGGFSRFARLTLLIAAIVVGVGCFVWRVVMPYLRRINALYAAREIERAAPALKGGLVNLVDLQHANKQIPEHVRTAIEKHAALELSHVDVEQAVDRRPLMRVSYLLLGVVTVCCLYALFSPKDILASVKRALLPTSATAPPTQTRITDVEPGDIEVVARSIVQVKANIGGREPESVVLYYSTSDHKYLDEPIPMQRENEDLPAFVADLSGENGRGLLADVTYRIEAGDAATRDYRVTVVKPPSAEVQSVSYAFPSYMEMEDRTEPTGHINAHVGTVVTVRAEASIPVEMAKIVFVENDRPTGEEIRMNVAEGRKLSVEWPLEIRDDGTFAPHYWIQCRTADGRTDPDPTRYNVMIKPDLPPEVELLSPQHDLKMPANGIIPLLFRAADPDFRLRSVRLIAVKDGTSIVSQPLIDEDEYPKSVSGGYDWELEPLNLTPGDRLEFYLQVKDNRHPLANTQQTPRLNLDIVEPVSEEEAQKQLEEEKQKQEEQAEDAADKQQQQAEEQQQKSEDAAQSEGDDRSDNSSDEGDSGAPQEGDDESEDGEVSDTTKPGEGESDESADPKNKQGRDEAGTSDETSPDGKEGEERPLDPNDRQDQEEALKRLLEHDRQQRERDQQQDSEKQPGEKGEPDPEQRPDQQQNRDQQQPQQPGDPQQQNRGGNDDQQQPPRDPQGNAETDPANPEGSDGEGDQNQQGNQKPDDKPPQKNSQKRPGDQGDSTGGDDSAGDDSPDTGDEDSSRGNQTKPTQKPQDDGAGGADSKPADKRPDGQPPAEQDENTGGAEQPAPDDPNAKKTEATGDETGRGKAADKQDAEKAKKQLDREGDKDERGRKPGDPDQQPQAQERGNPDDPNASQVKPKPRDPNQPKPETKPGEQADKPRNDSQQRPEQKPDGSEETPQGPGRKDQKSPEPREGEQGSSTENEQGAEGSPEKGAGDETQKPGDQADKNQQPPGGEPKPGEPKPGEPQPGEQKPGDPQPGEQKPGQAPNEATPSEDGAPPSQGEPGEGKEGDSGKSNDSGQSPSTSPQPGDPSSAPVSPQPGGGGGGDAPPEGEQANGGPGAEGEGEGQAAGDPQGGDDGDSPPPQTAPEKANEEYTKKAVELTLDRIKGDLERGEVDQELLDELGWSEEELRQFADRMQDQIRRLDDQSDSTPAGIAERRQFEEMLKDLKPQTQVKKRTSATENQQRVNQLDAKERKKVPLQYRSRARAYTRSLSKSANPDGDGKPAAPKTKK